MPKQFQSDTDARIKLMAGIDTLAQVVGITLGPKGRNVILDQEFGPPQVCSDGVTIAKEIELEEPFQNIGVQLAKVAASKTNDSVGDGTTTSTILAQGILQAGFKNLTAGADPMAIKRGIDKATHLIKQELASMAQPVSGLEQISRVASLAAHDNEMGSLIADVMHKIGSDGVITVEESKGLVYEVDYVEGMQIDRGYISPYFVTDQSKMETEIQNPYILITEEKITAVSDLLPLLEKLASVARELVIIAEDLEGEALAMLVVNKLKGTLNCLAVKAPGFGERRKAMLEDIAILTGGTVVSKETGRSFDSTEISDLGRCTRVIANKDDTTFVGGKGASDAIEGRIHQIKAQAEETSSDYDREKLEERVAKLAGGVSVLRVGAATEIELREKKQRLEDALSATRAAMEEGIIPGGGTSLIRSVQSCLLTSGLTGDELIGANIVASAVELPLQLIAKNAGFSGEVVLQNVKDGDGDYGFDAYENRYGSMIQFGIIDPAKVAKSALENAASVAGMVLTTQSLITELNPMKLPAPYDD